MLMPRMTFRAGFLLVLVLVATAAAERVDDSILLQTDQLTVTRQDLSQELLLLTENERAQVLDNAEHLKGFLRRIYQDKHMTAEAERLGLDQQPEVVARLMIERRRILSLALREHTRQQIKTPDYAALAREHYLARRDEFQVPEQFQAAHILKKVACDCERDAQRHALEQLRIRLQAGEAFAELAKAESDDPGSAARGGDLGRWLKREDLVAPFADALAALDIGRLSDLVETQFGFHLIKKLDYQPARLQSFEDVRDQIESRLRQTYIQDQLLQRALGYLPPPDARFDEPTLEALLRDR